MIKKSYDYSYKYLLNIFITLVNMSGIRPKIANVYVKFVIYVTHNGKVHLTRNELGSVQNF